MSRRACNFIDMSGKRFGRWFVLNYIGSNKWRCRCECGAVHVVDGCTLRDGRSMGCFACSVRNRKARKHGLSRDVRRPYCVWWDMLARCEDRGHSSYKDYGGRGVSVCRRWYDICLFYEDMGPRPTDRHSLERVDNDGHYTPENCVWATMKVQSRNKRTSKLLMMGGKMRTQAEWAEVAGISSGTIGDRLRRGWSVKDAVFCPVQLQSGKNY